LIVNVVVVEAMEVIAGCDGATTVVVAVGVGVGVAVGVGVGVAVGVGVGVAVGVGVGAVKFQNEM
jgi:hypothetical protein